MCLTALCGDDILVNYEEASQPIRGVRSQVAIGNRSDDVLDRSDFAIA